MNVILDLLGAGLIGGVVMLMIFNLNIHSSTSKFYSDSNLRLQHHAKTLAEIINNDLRKIGFKYNGNPFTEAEEKKVSFYSDINSDGTANLVTLALSDSTEAAFSENPRDKIYLRIIDNDTSKGPSLGLVDLKFTYRNLSGGVVSSVDSIKYIQAEIWVETIEPVDTSYLFTYWEMTIKPRNIK